MPPLLIGAAVSAAAGLGAAKMQSSAAKNAAKAQQQGTDRALQLQQQANQPYMDLGKQGVDRLMSMGAPQPYTQQFQPRGQQMPGQPRPQAPSNGVQAFQPGGQGPMPTLGSIGQPPPQGPPQGGMPPQGQMVNLRAPDGSVRPFPAQDAQRIMAQAQSQGHRLEMV